MTTKFQILFSVLILLITSCATSKVENIDYHRLIRNTTFSDVHRNPKVIANEYFEFKSSTFTYSFARKKFEDEYFLRSAYQGIYVVTEDVVLLTVQKMLYCDREVIGHNQPTDDPKKSEDSAHEDEEEEDKCTYSYYDIELLKSKNLLDLKSIKMPNKFKIVKTPNVTKIIALDKHKDAVYEAKDPLTY